MRSPIGAAVVAAIGTTWLLGATTIGSAAVGEAEPRSGSIVVSAERDAHPPLHSVDVEWIWDVLMPSRHDLAEDEVGAVTLIPDAQLRTALLAGFDVESIRKEGRRNGSYETHDGELLRGRIVVDELVIPAGTEVFVEEGTQIITTGVSRLDGWIIPTARDSAPRKPIEMPMMEAIEQIDLIGTPTPNLCPELTPMKGPAAGPQSGIVFLHLADVTITDAFAGICGGGGAGVAADPLEVPGSRSALGIGGRGGSGANILIIGGAGVFISVNGPICNTAGGAGGYVKAEGEAGSPCDCGGDAFAIGGRGGDAGSVFFLGEFIFFDVFAKLSVRPAGRGGDALAIGGRGGDCPECGVAGGRGGYASAVGGEAGRGGRIVVVTSGLSFMSIFTLMIDAVIDEPAAGGVASR